jgi:serine/threonine protein kinase
MSTHPFIVQYRFAHLDHERIYIATEHVGGGDLLSFLGTRGPLSRDEALCHAGEVCLALGHLHALDFVYRNLVPENVLIGLDGHAKLADFGVCVKLQGRVADTPPPPTRMSLNGTPEFTSPEQLLSEPSCQDSDWWSFGCLLCEILTGSTPFAHVGNDVRALLQAILHSPIRVPTHQNIGINDEDIIVRLLNRDVNDRIGARARGAHGYLDILTHTWFADVTVEALLRKQIPPPWLPLQPSEALIAGDAEELMRQHDPFAAWTHATIEGGRVEQEPATSEEPEKSYIDATDSEQWLMSDDEPPVDVGGASVSPAGIDGSPVSTMVLHISERSTGVAEAWVKNPTENKARSIPRITRTSNGGGASFDQFRSKLVRH